MREKERMKRIMESEIRKIHTYPRWRFYRIVSPQNVDEELELIRSAGVRARKMKIQRQGNVVAYKIEVED